MTEKEEKPIRSVSYSQYSLWATCPQQWKLKYIDGHKDESNINLVFGTSIHETVQHWLTLLYGEHPARAKTFDMHEHFKEVFIKHVKAELLAGDKMLTTKQEMAEFYAGLSWTTKAQGCRDEVQKWNDGLFSSK